MTKAEQFYAGQQNLLAKYDAQSKQLMLDAMQFDDVLGEHFTLPEMVYLLRNAYKERITHHDVLGENTMRTNTDPTSGFCLITTYLIYSMTGGDKVWEIHGARPLHWWLVHKQTNKIFDITYSQFKPELLNNLYKNGSPFVAPDEQFMDMLKQKAHTLAHRAGLE
jgi:hypothetical protein